MKIEISTKFFTVKLFFPVIRCLDDTFTLVRGVSFCFHSVSFFPLASWKVSFIFLPHIFCTLCCRHPHFRSIFPYSMELHMRIYVRLQISWHVQPTFNQEIFLCTSWRTERIQFLSRKWCSHIKISIKKKYKNYTNTK